MVVLEWSLLDQQLIIYHLLFLVLFVLGIAAMSTHKLDSSPIQEYRWTSTLKDSNRSCTWNEDKSTGAPISSTMSGRIWSSDCSLSPIGRELSDPHNTLSGQSRSCNTGWSWTVTHNSKRGSSRSTPYHRSPPTLGSRWWKSTVVRTLQCWKGHPKWSNWWSYLRTRGKQLFHRWSKCKLYRSFSDRW